MRARSKKQAALYVTRRKLVAEFLMERPVCERCQQARSDDVHELLSRARGGSISDESNLAALCRPCHREVTENPAQAALDGWVRSRWSA